MSRIPMPRSLISRGLNRDSTDSYIISIPAMVIMEPSISALMSSTFPCPKGWEWSAGWAERYNAKRPMNAATTLTVVSMTSVRMAVELVMKYATSFTNSRSTASAAIPFCKRKFSLSTLTMGNRWAFSVKRIVGCPSRSGTFASRRHSFQRSTEQRCRQGDEAHAEAYDER